MAMPAASTTSKPDISVCIANYNGGSLVLDCLASVYAQTGEFGAEVLVHDDASTDDSLQRIRDAFPQVRIIASNENCGYCVSNNRLAEAASGRFLLLLNNDAVLRPDSLQRLAAFARDGHEDCIIGLPEFAMDGTLIDRGFRTDPFLNPMPMLASGTHEAGVATAACLWIPRRAWDAIGGFPPWFESVAEDIFMCLAARLLGYRVLVLDAPGFDHWLGRQFGGSKVVDGGLLTTTRRRALTERNKTFAMLCCYPWPALLLLLPLHALLLACEALFLAVTGTGPAKIHRIYAGIPAAIWTHRHDIRGLRKRMIQQRRGAWCPVFAFTDWFPHKLRMLLRHGRPELQ